MYIRHSSLPRTRERVSALQNQPQVDRFLTHASHFASKLLLSLLETVSSEALNWLRKELAVFLRADLSQSMKNTLNLKSLAKRLANTDPLLVIDVFTHCLTHSFTHSLTVSLTHPLTHSLSIDHRSLSELLQEGLLLGYGPDKETDGRQGAHHSLTHCTHSISVLSSTCISPFCLLVLSLSCSVAMPVDLGSFPILPAALLKRWSMLLRPMGQHLRVAKTNLLLSLLYAVHSTCEILH